MKLCVEGRARTKPWPQLVVGAQREQNQRMDHISWFNITGDGLQWDAELSLTVKLLCFPSVFIYLHAIKQFGLAAHLNSNSLSAQQLFITYPPSLPFSLSHCHCFIACSQCSQGTITAYLIAQQHARPSQQAPSPGFTRSAVIKLPPVQCNGAF